jgi:hypothetical protein
LGTKGRAQEESSADGASAENRVATLRALLALHGGHALVELDDGSFAVSKWGLSRRLETLAELEQCARHVGVPVS